MTIAAVATPRRPEPLRVGAVPAARKPAASLASDSLKLSGSVGVWSEFQPFSGLIELLPRFKQNGAAMIVAVTPESAQDPSLVALFQAARAAGVEVRPWLLVAKQDGYWANKWNAAAVSRFVEDFVDRMERLGLKPGTVTLDVEPPVALTEALQERLGHLDLKGAHALLQQSSRSGSLTEAREAYQQLVGTMHARGVRVHAVTSPLVIDDMRVGHQRLQSAMGTPIEGIDWDEVSVMAYRPEFSRMLGPVSKVAGPFNAAIVYSYAQDTVRLFGDRAGLDLGEVGAPGFPAPVEGYRDPKELAADVAAAHRGGIRQTHLYSLDGMQQEGGLDRWLAEPEPPKPARDLKSHVLRGLIQLVARTLPAGDAPESDR